MQTPSFGSKIKIKKIMSKMHFTNHLELFGAKKPIQKTLNIPERGPF